MNPLPPQAYTKETLAKAFAWLQSQPENIKELASSTDVLVSLYLKAKLNGESALDRPSIQNFKSELKSLAGMMGEFEEESTAHGAGAMSFNSPPSHNPPSHLNTYPKFPSANSASSTASTRTFQPNPPAAPPRVQADPIFSQADLRFDPRTCAMIQEVKDGFNLSSDGEALRLLVSVGFKSLKKL